MKLAVLVNPHNHNQRSYWRAFAKRYLNATEAADVFFQLKNGHGGRQRIRVENDQDHNDVINLDNTQFTKVLIIGHGSPTQNAQGAFNVPDINDIIKRIGKIINGRMDEMNHTPIRIQVCHAGATNNFQRLLRDHQDFHYEHSAAPRKWSYIDSETGNYYDYPAEAVTNKNEFEEMLGLLRGTSTQPSTYKTRFLSRIYDKTQQQIRQQSSFYYNLDRIKTKMRERKEEGWDGFANTSVI